MSTVMSFLRKLALWFRRGQFGQELEEEMAFHREQSRLDTTNGVSNDITVIDVGSLKAIKSVPVGQSPWGVVSRP